MREVGLKCISFNGIPRVNIGLLTLEVGSSIDYQRSWGVSCKSTNRSDLTTINPSREVSEESIYYPVYRQHLHATVSSS
jgi:hypothetical protein